MTTRDDRAEHGPLDAVLRLGQGEVAGYGTGAATAHLFQEQVRKAYEVRLTVVDDNFFAVRIDAGPAGPVHRL